GGLHLRVALVELHEPGLDDARHRRRVAGADLDRALDVPAHDLGLEQGEELVLVDRGFQEVDGALDDDHEDDDRRDQNGPHAGPTLLEVIRQVFQESHVSLLASGVVLRRDPLARSGPGATKWKAATIWRASAFPSTAAPGHFSTVRPGLPRRSMLESRCAHPAPRSDRAGGAGGGARRAGARPPRARPVPGARR